MDIGTIILIVVIGIIIFLLGTQLGINTAGKILKKESEEFKKQQKLMEQKRLQLNEAAEQMRQHSHLVDELLGLADQKTADIKKLILSGISREELDIELTDAIEKATNEAGAYLVKIRKKLLGDKK